MTPYDLVVVGGGAAGLVTSAGAAGLGARVALVERERMGGECLWTGCVPSKALLAAAAAAHDAHAASRFGVDAGPVRPDFARVMAWVHGAQRRIAPHDSPERFRALGVDVIAGTARFTGERTLRVDGAGAERTLAAKRVVLATGSRPAIPEVAGLDHVPYHTNETIFALDRQPASLLVLGGGPIGLELAQAFARLGTRVRVLEAGARLLPQEDEELVALLRARLEGEGVAIHTRTTAERVSRDGRGDGVRLEARGPDGQTSWTADALLVATGRRPNLDMLDLARGGVAVRDGALVVDDRLRTTARGVWAIGDLVGPLRFTHVADYQARLVVRNAFFPGAARVDYRAVPWAIFTDPELAHVGLTEAEARARHGDRVRVWRRELAALDRAVADGTDTGLVKLVTDPRGRILGGHVLGRAAASLIAEIALAMRHGIGAAALATTVHAYPTYPEAVRQAAEGYYKSRFTGVAKTVAGWLVRR